MAGKIGRKTQLKPSVTIDRSYLKAFRNTAYFDAIGPISECSVFTGG